MSNIHHDLIGSYITFLQSKYKEQLKRGLEKKWFFDTCVDQCSEISRFWLFWIEGRDRIEFNRRSYHVTNRRQRWAKAPRSYVQIHGRKISWLYEAALRLSSDGLWGNIRSNADTSFFGTFESLYIFLLSETNKEPVGKRRSCIYGCWSSICSGKRLTPPSFIEPNIVLSKCHVSCILACLKLFSLLSIFACLSACLSACLLQRLSMNSREFFLIFYGVRIITPIFCI